MQEQNNATYSRNNDFLSFAEDICKKLKSLEELSFEDQYFKDQSKALIKDFFLNNLYVFHQCLHLERTQKFKDTILSLYNNINLYHYTTYETLEKIITGKSLKLSRITDMNDKNECRALFYFYNTMYNESNDKEKIKNEAFKKLYNYYTSKIFSFSFSALKDDAAQWERYGVKIAFFTLGYGEGRSTREGKLVDILFGATSHKERNEHRQEHYFIVFRYYLPDNLPLAQT